MKKWTTVARMDATCCIRHTTTVTRITPKMNATAVMGIRNTILGMMTAIVVAHTRITTDRIHHVKKLQRLHDRVN